MQSMRTFQNDVIIITGAASGLGLRMALQLMQRGAAVGAVDLSNVALETLQREGAGGRLATAVADVTERTALFAAIRSIEDRLGPCDRLIANAGIGIGTPAVPFSSADFERVVQVNLLGVANSVEAVLPGMIARKRGHLVAISSLASFRGIPAMSGYCAAKAGVNALFDSLRVELKPHGIRATTICPGWIRTPMSAKFEGSIRNMLDPDAAVERLLKFIQEQRTFVAFPLRMSWLLYVMRWLPPAIGDRLLQRHIAKLRNTTS